jgi:hydrogenase expression/formation protein HypC
MCLSVPAQIIKVEGEMADVSVGGTIFRAGVQMIENPVPGDYILLHAGFAIERISEKDALETLRIIEELTNQKAD